VRMRQTRGKARFRLAAYVGAVACWLGPVQTTHPSVQRRVLPAVNTPSPRTQTGANPVLRTVHVAVNPLALVVDAPTQRVFVFSSSAHESRVSVLDAARL